MATVGHDGRCKSAANVGGWKSPLLRFPVPIKPEFVGPAGNTAFQGFGSLRPVEEHHALAVMSLSNLPLDHRLDYDTGTHFSPLPKLRERPRSHGRIFVINRYTQRRDATVL
jgi:hypothetical protein